MNNNIVFSWAEDAYGGMVHVDTVPRGLQCGCRCPYCHEPLLARQGEKNEHGFAHHSETRQAKLEICYMVTLYKLAEQIIREQRHIYAPSYYGIFPAMDISFVDVRIDSSLERADKQPDVIATTADGEKYLIEFTFEYKVRHKQPVDYNNLTCIEIDLSKQTLDTLHKFLTSKPTDDWKWVNNALFFSRIEERYTKAGKKIKVVCEDECQNCELVQTCCAVKEKTTHNILRIYNNGKQYRICKLEVYAERQMELLKRHRQEEQWQKEQEERERQQKELMRIEEEERENRRREREEKRRKEEEERKRRLESMDPSMRSCFDCQSNLKWANRNGYANCGCYMRLGVPENTPPDLAKTCSGYKPVG